MKVGIIGLGQSGKSSLFHTLTEQAPEPPSGKPHRRMGRALVPDEKVEYIARNENSLKKTYAEVTFVDPDGFSPDSTKSLIAELLGMVRGSDLLALVIRAFSAPSVMHPLGSVDGLRDLKNCFSDLVIQDLAVFEGRYERSIKAYERGEKALKPELDTIEKIMSILNKGQFLLKEEWSKQELAIINNFEPLTAKNGVVVWNVDENAAFGRGGVGVPQDVKNISAEQGWGVGSVRLSLESEVMEIDRDERVEFGQELGLYETARDRFLTAVYDRLGLLSFYTAGPKEAAARAIRRGDTAWDAAGKIHSDIQRGFIRAEVMSFEDYKKYGSEEGVKKAGRYRIEKKEYVVQEGDIVYFRFNV
jgi:GTP-binding protein YchF